MVFESAVTETKQEDVELPPSAPVKQVSYLQVALNFTRRCYNSFAKGAPPEPCDEVKELLHDLGMKPAHLLPMYRLFRWMVEIESDYEIVDKAVEVGSDYLQLLIAERRKYVLRLLRCLMRLGDCEKTVTWDQFLWVLLRFCALNRVELAQALFLCVITHQDSETFHYIRWQDLQEFFSFYHNCPVASFDTADINFDFLPLRRYYASDFAELLMRFNVLLNPMLHLQQSLQAQLPGLDFWDNAPANVSFCRKITFDYFLMSTGRMFLRGEPPFRETCEMLAPDALGAEPINQDQWILRTWVAKGGQGIAHFYVWGEQPSPEVMELRAVAKKEAAEKARLEKEKKRQEEEKETGAVDAASKTEPNQSAKPKPSPKPAKKHLTNEVKEAWATGTPRNTLDVMLPDEEAARLALHALALDEELAAPLDLLPPGWMKGVTIAPAVQIRGIDRPLRRSLVDPYRAEDGQDPHATWSSTKQVSFKP